VIGNGSIWPCGPLHQAEQLLRVPECHIGKINGARIAGKGVGMSERNSRIGKDVASIFGCEDATLLQRQERRRRDDEPGIVPMPQSLDVWVPSPKPPRFAASGSKLGPRRGRWREVNCLKLCPNRLEMRHIAKLPELLGH